MSKPVLSYNVMDGGHYWAAWGKSGWSAVRVLETKRKTAEAERVDPKTGAITTRKAKVRLDRLVRRDPKLKGEDRPGNPPAEVFIEVLSAPEPSKVEEPKIVSAQKPQMKRTPEEEKARRKEMERLLDLFEDKSTTDYW